MEDPPGVLQANPPPVAGGGTAVDGMDVEAGARPSSADGPSSPDSSSGGVLPVSGAGDGSASRPSTSPSSALGTVAVLAAVPPAAAEPAAVSAELRRSEEMMAEDDPRPQPLQRTEEGTQQVAKTHEEGGDGVKQGGREEEEEEAEDEEEPEDDLHAAARAAQAPAWDLPMDATAATVAARTAAAAPLLLRQVEVGDEGDDQEDDDEEEEEEEDNMVAGDVKEEDEESGNKAAGGKAGFDASEIPRTKHEVAPTQISEEDLVVVIPPESALEPAGSVEGIVEGFLVISADISRPTLDIDSILCFQDRTPLGKVFEVFGPVKKPYYSVTSANVERLKKEGKEGSLDKGTPVFFVPGASSFVHPTTIYTRGSDASGEHDEEPPEDELEFSDDEQESLYRRQRKQKLQEQRRKAHEWEGNAEMCLSGSTRISPGSGRGRGERGRRRAANRGGFAGGGWSRPAALPVPSYAGAADEYTPLQRPSHLVDHVMSNPSYGGPAPHYQPYPLIPTYGGYSHYTTASHPAYGSVPVQGPAAPTLSYQQPTALPLPHPTQITYGGPAYAGMHVQAQASWQNQFYASPHHHQHHLQTHQQQAQQEPKQQKPPN